MRYPRLLPERGGSLVERLAFVVFDEMRSQYDEQQYLESPDYKFVIWQLLSLRDMDIKVPLNLDRARARLIGMHLDGTLTVVVLNGGKR